MIVRVILCYINLLLGAEWDCGTGWAASRRKCYKLVMNYSDIEECRKDCMLEGGDLASIHSKEENDFIQTLQKENLVWFGGRIAEKDGEFSWIDGSEWNYDSWDESEQKLSNYSSV